MNTVPSPNADNASRDAAATASSSSSAPRTTRIPRPPPPAAAFTSAGYVTVAPSAIRPSTTSIIDVVGTPASSAARLAATLSPSRVTCSGVGPTQTRPASMTACANAAFSARKP